MTILKNLSKMQLVHILKLKNWDELQSLPFMLAQLEELEALSQHDENLENNKSSQSIIEAITDGPIYPFYILWTLIGLIKLNIISLSIITAGFSTLTIVSGGIFYYLSHRALKEEANTAHQFFQLDTLKDKVADELTLRYKTELRAKHITIPKNPARAKQSAKLSNEHVLPDCRQSLSASLLLFATIFGTYFLGSNAIIAAFNLTVLSTAMLGPIGLAAAVGISALCSIYFGYQHYRAYVNNEKLRQNQQKLEEKVEEKIEYYEILKKSNVKPSFVSFFSKKIPPLAHIIPVKPKKRSKNMPHKFARGQSIMFNMKRIMSKNTGPFIPQYSNSRGP